MQVLQVDSFSRQELKSSSCFSPIPIKVISKIFECLSFQSIACLSATEEMMRKETGTFVLKKWQDLGLQCFSSEELGHLSRKYFCEIIKEVGGIESTYNVCQLVKEVGLLGLHSSVENSEDIPKEVSNLFSFHLANNLGVSSQALFNSELAERIQTPLKRLHVLEKVQKDTNTKVIFVIIKKAYNLLNNFSNVSSPLSETKFFKLIQTWNVQREDSIDAQKEKENAIKSVLAVSTLKKIDIGMLTILLQNGAFEKDSPYPARFVVYASNLSDDFTHVKVILDLFHKYGVCLDNRNFPKTPIQMAGSELLENILKLSSRGRHNKESSIEIDALLSQIHISANIIKYLIKKGVSINQEIKLVKDGAINRYSLLEAIQVSLQVLKGLHNQYTKIIENLGNIIQLCIPVSNVGDVQ